VGIFISFSHMLQLLVSVRLKSQTLPQNSVHCSVWYLQLPGNTSDICFGCERMQLETASSWPSRTCFSGLFPSPVTSDNLTVGSFPNPVRILLYTIIIPNLASWNHSAYLALYTCDSILITVYETLWVTGYGIPIGTNFHPYVSVAVKSSSF